MTAPLEPFDPLGMGIIPPIPPARGYESTTSIELPPRYEDIAQNGRVQLSSLMPGLGAVWASLATLPSTEAFSIRGVVPILHRAVFVGEPGPFAVQPLLETSGTWRLARETDGDRLFLDMWIETRAPIASTFGPRPPADAPRALVGRVYASHVFTRPFAPPGERRVTRFDVPGIPPIPEDDHPYADADALTAGRPLEPAGEHLFGMLHTDSNQHVNSLVYPRLFEEAVIPHLPPPATHHARTVELRWRKPFFAGERAAILLNVSPDRDDPAAHPAGVVAVGAFTPVGTGTGTRADGVAPLKPNTTVAMRLT